MRTTTKLWLIWLSLLVVGVLLITSPDPIVNMFTGGDGPGFNITLKILGVLLLLIAIATTASNRKDLQKNSEAHQNTIREAIRTVDLVMQNYRYIGLTAKVVYTNEGPKIGTEKGDRIEVDQLCKTEGGNWFKLAFRTLDGHLDRDSVKVSPVSEDNAKLALGRLPEVYEEEFGPISIA